MSTKFQAVCIQAALFPTGWWLKFPPQLNWQVTGTEWNKQINLKKILINIDTCIVDFVIQMFLWIKREDDLQMHSSTSICQKSK